MPAKLDRCVEKLKKKGMSDPAAWGSCVKSTGIKRKKGGGWAKTKKTPTGAVKIKKLEKEK